jgi:hypothetical protein
MFAALEHMDTEEGVNSVGHLVNAAWDVLRMRMEGWPPAIEGSCECIE